MKSLYAAVICASLVLPFAALAQMSDADYCNALAAAYRKDHGAGSQTGADVANALASCGTNAKASIPTLEKALTDEKITLPKRT
jgi:hypothetical protein